MSGRHGRVLVIDVGTTGTRAAIVHGDARVTGIEYRRTPPDSPFPGLVEFDAVALADTVLELARRVLAEGGPVDAVGISTQRASTIVWDRRTGIPVAPALGWQDLRTVGECITAKAEHGLALAPNQTATKAAWLLGQHDPQRTRDLCIGTVDSWLVWQLSRGAAHVTDRSNAAITGLARVDGSDWDDDVLGVMRIDRSALPSMVDSIGGIVEATALPGAPLIAGLGGDQQCSLIGQSCVRPGQAKCTFGTGGMLDVVTGEVGPSRAGRDANGTFPIVAWSIDGRITWGAEAIMLTAGTSIDWLVEDLGLIAHPADSAAVAASVPDTGGAVFVPALMGLGTPRWDYGARGTLVGVTRGTTRAHVVRAVLDGIAHRAADLVTAAGAAAGAPLTSLRVDGGMSANPTFVSLLANATGIPIEVAPHTECTTLGAGYLAGLGSGLWADLESVGAAWAPSTIVEPEHSPTADTARAQARSDWARAVDQATGWIPALTALDF